MIDLIKKTVLAGIGATVITKERVEVAVQDLVKQGRLTATEAKAFADKLAEDGRREFEVTSRELGERLRELLASADFARKAELATLEARVRELEEKLARLATKD